MTPFLKHSGENGSGGENDELMHERMRRTLAYLGVVFC
jgi:hypothetical protein